METQHQSFSLISIPLQASMRQYIDTITMRNFKRNADLSISAQDILMARGDQLHVMMLTMILCYSIFFSAANFYFQNFPQAYLTMIPIPLEVVFYIFFRMGGRWMLISKMANLLLIITMLALLKILDGPSTGVLSFFIPVIVGSMITLQGEQRPYAWVGIFITLCVLGFLSVTEFDLHTGPPMSDAKLIAERLQNYLGAAMATIFQVGFLIWVSNQLQDRLVQNEREQQRLISKLSIQSEEKQRNEVAIELHENINQVLATAKVNLDMQQQVQAAERIQQSAEQIDYALYQIKKLYHTLVTPALQDFELTDLIQQMVDELFSEEDVRILFESKLDSAHPISDEIKLSLYRIAQEHLQVVRMHAQSDRLEIKLLAESNHISFHVRDNGLEFDLDQTDINISIRSIENRVKLHNGKFQLVYSSTEGRVLSIILPFS